MHEPLILARNLRDEDCDYEIIEGEGMPEGAFMFQPIWHGHEVTRHPNHPEWGNCAVHFGYPRQARQPARTVVSYQEFLTMTRDSLILTMTEKNP